MKHVAAAIPLLLLAAPGSAQTPPPPTPPATTPNDDARKPPLPPVPQETPHDTGPGVSPATPGINLDAPEDEVITVTPVDPATLPVNPPAPEDEQNDLVIEQGEGDVAASVDNQRRTVLEGDVRLRYRGYRVRARRAVLDDARRTATFEGSVELESGGQTAFGDSLVLDLRSRQFRDFMFQGGKAVVPPERVGPNLLLPLRLSGETLQRVGRDVVATNGFLTTCDFPAPHYKLGFARALLKPNRLILRDTTFYRRDRRLFRLPYLAIPLNDRTFRYNYLPEVGRTNEEGFYVKAALGYVLRDALPGIARLDLMQKKGVGLGFDQTYSFGGAAGTLVLYALNDQNRKVNNVSGRLNHQQKFGDYQFGATTDFQQNSYRSLSPTSRSRQSTFALGRTAGGTSQSLNFNLSSSDYGFGASGTRSWTFTQSERLGASGNATFRYNGSRYETAGGLGASRDESADLQARATVGIFDLDFAANKILAQGGGGSGYFSGTERLPEITLGTDTFRFARGFLRTLPLRLSVGYGRFVEGGFGGRSETNRALLSVDANPREIGLGGGLGLQVGGTLRQTVYDDAAQYVLSGRGQLTRRLGGSSSFNLTYGYLRPYGFATLRSDQSGSFNNTSANLTVQRPRLRLTLFTGYDIQRARQELVNPSFNAPDDPGFNPSLPTDTRRFLPTNPWQNVALQLALRPSDAFQTRFTGSYDINTGRLLDLTNRVRVRAPGGFNLDTGLRFDPRTGKFPQITGALETPLLGGRYNLSAFAGYNGFTRRFEYKNFALTRSWHDYDLTVTYVDQPFGFRSEKGFNLSFRLKAFPVFQRQGVGQFGTALDTGTGEVF